ncbi:20580_t:CDS:2 [Gigaspora margarita]|uniref:Cilia- and flagella-associated protein 300 n=1 Tax=Gigaspora margarita TaxID=4874 RepID=A0ABN7V7H9_GIGMA|nr:20580_t:CDS:2 [Gigaspora margarita]
MSEISSPLEHSNLIIPSKEYSSNTSGAVSPEPEPEFHFNYHFTSKIDGYYSTNVQDLLEKCYIKRFIYEEYFDPQTTDESTFLKTLFNNPFIRKECLVQHQNTWCEIKGPVDTVIYKRLSCQVTSLDFFDRLYNHVTDKLRQIFLLSQSSNYDLFNNDDRNEFIFHVLQSVCLGGDICQFEDEINKYFEVVKSIYRDLICVQRNTSTGNLMVQSYVYKINNLQGTLLSPPLFPISESNDESIDNVPSNNFCYVTVDPVKRWVNVWYHAACEYFC